MQRLNITPLPPEEPKQLQRLVSQKTGYESPVGWWNVSTEGDVEGRSTSQLGMFYGHVVEIALHLASKCYYALSFHPVLNLEAGKRINYVATGRGVWVSLSSDSSIPGMEPSTRASALEKWFDAEGVVVSNKGPRNESYWQASYVKLK